MQTILFITLDSNGVIECFDADETRLDRYCGQAYDVQHDLFAELLRLEKEQPADFAHLRISFVDYNAAVPPRGPAYSQIDLKGLSTRVKTICDAYAVEVARLMGDAPTQSDPSESPGGSRCRDRRRRPRRRPA
jgi:hypothetical protein